MTVIHHGGVIVPAVSGDIPVLTLPAVLFPGTFLPVQVADEADRALLRDCARGNHQLGVVLASADTGTTVPCVTGCLARVARFTGGDDEYDDDVPLSAVLYGIQRFRIREFVQQDPYLTGRIEVIKEYVGVNAGRRTQQTARLFQEYLTLIRQQYSADVVKLSLPDDDPTTASYLLASVLCLPLEIKQRWLESASTAQRLEEELAYLSAECEKHEALLQLSRFMRHRYTTPDPQRYLGLSTKN